MRQVTVGNRQQVTIKRQVVDRDCNTNEQTKGYVSDKTCRDLSQPSIKCLWNHRQSITRYKLIILSLERANDQRIDQRSVKSKQFRGEIILSAWVINIYLTHLFLY